MFPTPVESALSCFHEKSESTDLAGAHLRSGREGGIVFGPHRASAFVCMEHFRAVASSPNRTSRRTRTGLSRHRGAGAAIDQAPTVQGGSVAGSTVQVPWELLTVGRSGSTID